MTGVRHESEPDYNAQNKDYIGHLWELYDDEDLPTISEFATELLKHVELDARVKIDEVVFDWFKANKPSIFSTSKFLNRLVDIALECDCDVYDSDTRTWIFPQRQRIKCDICPCDVQ